jgi:prevent-host-death family protein
MAETILTATEARNRFTQLVKEVSDLHRHYLIASRGKAKAALIGLEEYESFLETCEIMADKNLVKAVKEGERDIKAGRLYSHKEVFGHSQQNKS